MKSRLPLALAALAALPLLAPGLRAETAPGNKTEFVGVAFTSPEPTAKTLEKSLDKLAERLRTVDATLAALVGDSVTDPSDRHAAFRKALSKVDTRSVKENAADAAKVGTELLAAWEKTAFLNHETVNKAEADGYRDDAKARYAALDTALRRMDEAIAAHVTAIRQTRASLGDSGEDPHLFPAQIIRSRPLAKRAGELGAKAAAAVNAAAVKARLIADAPTPALVEEKARLNAERAEDEKAFEQSKKASAPASPEAKSETPAPAPEPKPADKPASPAPAPKSETPTPPPPPAPTPAPKPETPAPTTPPPPPAPAPATPPPAPAPAPAPTDDPVPEPVEN